MSEYWLKGLFGLFLLISLVYFSGAAEPTGYLVYVQGGESNIVEGTDGMYEITVQDIIPFCTIIDEDEHFLAGTKHLVNESFPMDAALIMRGSDGKVASMVEIVNLSIDTKVNTITFRAHPLEYYSGELLKPFSSGKGELDAAIERKTNLTALYLEIMNTAPENYWSPPFQCCYEGSQGQCYMKC